MSDHNEKGARNEREAVHVLERVYGKRHVDRVDCGSGHDPLGLIDILAAKDGFATRFVQVKTNRFTKKAKGKYARIALRMPDDVRIEVWTRVDHEGWRFYEFDREDGWSEFLRVDSCDEETIAEAVREYVGFYEEVASDD